MFDRTLPCLICLYINKKIGKKFFCETYLAVGGTWNKSKWTREVFHVGDQTENCTVSAGLFWHHRTISNTSDFFLLFFLASVPLSLSYTLYCGLTSLLNLLQQNRNLSTPFPSLQNEKWPVAKNLKAKTINNIHDISLCCSFFFCCNILYHNSHIAFPPHAPRGKDTIPVYFVHWDGFRNFLSKVTSIHFWAYNRLRRIWRISKRNFKRVTQTNITFGT
jgi:hypothetical protein